MSDPISLSGLTRYKKPLRKKKTPFWRTLVLALFIIGFVALVFYYVTPPPKTTVREQNIDLLDPISRESIVKSDGSFVVGIFSNEPQDIDIHKAKVKTIRRFIPIVGTTTYKESAAIYLIRDDIITTVTMENFGSVREFRLSLFDKNQVMKNYTQRDRYSKRLQFVSLADRARFKIRTNEFTMHQDKEKISFSLFLKQIIRADMNARFHENGLNYMYKWTKNEALYYRMKVAKPTGTLEIPGRMLRLHPRTREARVVTNTTITTNLVRSRGKRVLHAVTNVAVETNTRVPNEPRDYLLVTYMAGVPPLKCVQEQVVGVLHSKEEEEDIIVSILFHQPRALTPAQAFFYFKGTWRPIPNLAVASETSEAIEFVSKEEGVLITFQRPVRVYEANTGFIFPRTRYREQYGDLAATFTINEEKMLFEGKAVKTWRKSIW